VGRWLRLLDGGSHTAAVVTRESLTADEMSGLKPTCSVFGDFLEIYTLLRQSAQSSLRRLLNISFFAVEFAGLFLRRVTSCQIADGYRNGCSIESSHGEIGDAEAQTLRATWLCSFASAGAAHAADYFNWRRY
jgi:hypothetical protein